jgi:DnaK suppressor protein
MPNIEDLRHQARQLCAERGLTIQPYANGWWIVGDGVSRVVGELAGQDLLHKHFAPYEPKPGEDYMSAKQLAHFRKILETLKKELGEDIDRTVHTMQDEATVFADPNDRASQETDIAIELRNRDRERKLIKKIDETLSSIESGDYGFCNKCGVEIGIKRLEARPTATLCIDCKTLDEMKERQMAK